MLIQDFVNDFLNISDKILFLLRPTAFEIEVESFSEKDRKDLINCLSKIKDAPIEIQFFSKWPFTKAEEEVASLISVSKTSFKLFIETTENLLNKKDLYKLLIWSQTSNAPLTLVPEKKTEESIDFEEYRNRLLEIDRLILEKKLQRLLVMPSFAVHEQMLNTWIMCNKQNPATSIEQTMTWFVISVSKYLDSDQIFNLHQEISKNSRKYLDNIKEIYQVSESLNACKR